MIQIVIRNGQVHDWHPTHVDLTHKYPAPDWEVVLWDGTFEIFEAAQANHELVDDPRTPRQRDDDRQQAVDRRRDAEHPNFHDVVDLLFEDQENDTIEFRDTIRAIRQRHPDA